MLRMHVSSSLCLLLGAIACGNAFGPERGDPAQFVVAQSTRYSCGSWSPRAPTETVGLFDVYFKSGAVESGRAPSSSEVRTVVVHGGAIVQRFEVNGARAILPVDAVSKVGAALIVGVTDASTTGHPVSLGFSVSGKGGLIAAQGGRVLWMASNIPDFYAIIPDPGIPVIRGDRDLRFLELSLPSCNGFD